MRPGKGPNNLLLTADELISRSGRRADLIVLEVNGWDSVSGPDDM